MVPRRPAQPRPAALALPLPAGRLPLPGPDRGERATRQGGLRVRAARHGGVRRTTATGSSRSPTPRRRRPRSSPASPSRTAARTRPRSTCCPPCGSATRGGGRPTRTSRSCRQDGDAVVVDAPPARRATGSRPRRARTARMPRALFCDNETNTPGCTASRAVTAYPKDGINDHVVSGAATVNPARRRDQGGLVVPPDGARRRARRRSGSACTGPSRRRRCGPGLVGRRAFDEVVADRRARGRRVLRGDRAGRHSTTSGCGSCARPAPDWSGASRSTPTRSAAGSTATPASPPPPAGRRTRTQRRLATPRLLRRARHARPVGVPVVRGLGPGVPRRSPGPTSTRRSPSTSCSCCCASGSSTPTARCRRTSGTSTTSTRRCTRWPPSGCSSSTAAPTSTSSSGSSRSCCSTSRGGSTGRTPTATTCSAAASSASTTSARSTARTCRPACGSSRPTAPRGWPTTRWRCSCSPARWPSATTSTTTWS